MQQKLTEHKNLQQNLCVLVFQFTKNDLKSHNVGLYPINKNISKPIHT